MTHYQSKEYYKAKSNYVYKHLTPNYTQADIKRLERKFEKAHTTRSHGSTLPVYRTRKHVSFQSKRMKGSIK